MRSRLLPTRASSVGDIATTLVSTDTGIAIAVGVSVVAIAAVGAVVTISVGNGVARLGAPVVVVVKLAATVGEAVSGTMEAVASTVGVAVSVIANGEVALVFAVTVGVAASSVAETVGVADIGGELCANNGCTGRVCSNKLANTNTRLIFPTTMPILLLHGGGNIFHHVFPVNTNTLSTIGIWHTTRPSAAKQAESTWGCL